MDIPTIAWNALITLAIGGVTVSIYRVAAWIYSTMMYRLTVTLEISTDQNLQWNWLQHYITDHMGLQLHHWTATGLSTEMDASLIPMTVHIPFEGRRVRLTITEAPGSDRVLYQGSSPKARRLATLWTRNVDKAFFVRLLTELKRVYIKKHEKYVKYSVPLVYQNSGDANWYGDRTLARRDLDTLTLDPKLVEQALREVDYFLSGDGQAFMRKRGVPYHLGLLLEGPPGNGKSSFILALASRLGSEVCKLSLQTTNMDDNSLSILMKGSARDDPPRLIVLEDVDCLTSKREGGGTVLGTEEKQSKISFSALLNCLDGLGAPENAIIIMTTNHPEKLDAALIRPGRVDLRLNFAPPDDSSVAVHYVKFFPEETVHSMTTLAFVKACREHSDGGAACSMAFVQGQILKELGHRKKEGGY